MRWTKTLIPTLRDDPSEAEIDSHKLMIRAGLMRKLTSGVYSYLPLGWLAIYKVINIVREEMNKAGAVELLMPVLQPIELWEESGRAEAFGRLMCKFKDRQGHINILGPTHEEIITNIIRNELSSYRQLPITLYQIQTKFRDEIRPRFGVIRTREFIMKDAYSFDVDEKGLDQSYKAQYDAYCKIFTRCGLKYKVVEAETGLMGGSGSHEFMVPFEQGEDRIVYCPKCNYSANAEKAECIASSAKEATLETRTLMPMKEVKTPGMCTVQQVAGYLGCSETVVVKTLIYKSGDKYIAAVVRGDHEVNPLKLAKAAKVEALELAMPDEVESVTKGSFGFTGPAGLDIPVICDHSIEHMQNFVTGANKKNVHYVNTNLYRDFKPSVFSDIRMAQEGDLCSRCMAKLEFSNAIEVGQIFKLGTKYSGKLEATYINEKGETKPMVMGCYGIGINRIIAAAIELNHDKDGIIWPKEIAPYLVTIVSVNPKDEKIYSISSEIYNKLKAAGVEVLWDDRDQTAGVKFMDADLVGIPIRITVGTKTISDKTVDIKLRNQESQRSIKIENIVLAVKDAVQNYRP